MPPLARLIAYAGFAAAIAFIALITIEGGEPTRRSNIVAARAL